MKKLAILFFLLLWMAGCTQEIVVTEDTLPSQIFCPKDSNTPYTGKCLVYYPNTQILHFSFEFEKGILNGEFKSYFRNGKLEFSGNYINGELKGKFLKYDSDGKLLLSHNIKNQAHRER